MKETSTIDLSNSQYSMSTMTGVVCQELIFFPLIVILRYFRVFVFVCECIYVCTYIYLYTCMRLYITMHSHTEVKGWFRVPSSILLCLIPLKWSLSLNVKLTSLARLDGLLAPRICLSLPAANEIIGTYGQTQLCAHMYSRDRNVGLQFTKQVLLTTKQSLSSQFFIPW